MVRVYCITVFRMKNLLKKKKGILSSFSVLLFSRVGPGMYERKNQTWILLMLLIQILIFTCNTVSSESGIHFLYKPSMVKSSLRTLCAASWKLYADLSFHIWPCIKFHESHCYAYIFLCMLDEHMFTYMHRHRI